MKIEAQIIKDSVGPNRKRITTFLLTYPRYIHSEVMTHRMVSKNSASSRAIPAKKLRQMVLNSPIIPNPFTKNQSGMSAKRNLGWLSNYLAKLIWIFSSKMAAFSHFLLEKLGVHKQHLNRILEPYLEHTIVATATDWDNFFALRIHEDAQPEIHRLALAMYSIRNWSVPQELKEGEWHLPFVNSTEGTVENIRKSVACCARTSYLNHNKTMPSQMDYDRLYERLVQHNPKHCSPTEHQAQASSDPDLRSGNLNGWTQYRKTLENENIQNVETFWLTKEQK